MIVPLTFPIINLGGTLSKGTAKEANKGRVITGLTISERIVMTEAVLFGASIEEYDGFLVIARFYYPSRSKPLVELFYDFDDAVASLEKKGYVIDGYNPSVNTWSFIKHAKKRDTRSAKALRALMERKGVRNGKKQA